MRVEKKIYTIEEETVIELEDSRIILERGDQIRVITERKRDEGMTYNGWHFTRAPLFWGHHTYSKSLPDGKSKIYLEPRHKLSDGATAVFHYSNESTSGNGVNDLLDNKSFDEIGDAMDYIRRTYKLKIDYIDLEDIL